METLYARFERAVMAAGATHCARSALDDLVARYGEPHRHYHTLHHVKACLGWLDRLATLAEAPDELELALWFHDAVYLPRRGDNEHMSAKLARGTLAPFTIPEPSVGRICRHIEATAKHERAAGDVALMVDIDLSILGAAGPDFERFEKQVRREYAHVPQALYRKARAAVLERFLLKPSIYQLPTLKQGLELQARTNLELRIAQLKEPAPAP